MFYRFINQSVKKYLDNDPETAHQLRKLGEKNIVVGLTDLNLKTLVTIDAGVIELSDFKEDENDKSHASIQANVISLLQIAMGADYHTFVNKGSVKIDGDADLVNQLRTIFTEIDFDWEEIVAKYFGDGVAYQTGLVAKKVKDYKTRSFENFRLDVSEYLREESRILPTQIELDHFYKEIDTLSADIDRIEARARRLLEKCEK